MKHMLNMVSSRNIISHELSLELWTWGFVRNELIWPKIGLWRIHFLDFRCCKLTRPEGLRRATYRVSGSHVDPAAGELVQLGRSQCRLWASHPESHFCFPMFSPPSSSNHPKILPRTSPEPPQKFPKTSKSPPDHPQIDPRSTPDQPPSSPELRFCDLRWSYLRLFKYI